MNNFMFNWTANNLCLTIIINQVVMWKVIKSVIAVAFKTNYFRQIWEKKTEEKKLKINYKHASSYKTFDYHHSINPDDQSGRRLINLHAIICSFTRIFLWAELGRTLCPRLKIIRLCFAQEYVAWKWCLMYLRIFCLLFYSHAEFCFSLI